MPMYYTIRSSTDGIMSRSPAHPQHGLAAHEGTRLLSSDTSIQDEKMMEYQCFGSYSEKPIVLTRDGKGRRVFLRLFVIITSLLVVATWIAHTHFSWVVERVCHRTGLCTIDQITPGPILDAPPTAPEDIVKDPNVMKDTPQYVLDYAPLVHLHDQEEFWPGDMSEHLLHITPELNYTPIEKSKLQAAPNLTNLHHLNAFERGRHVYLTSNDDVEDRPAWLSGAKNIPTKIASPNTNRPWSGFESKGRGARKGTPGRSAAPAILITVDKGNGIVDAFWFFFYSYNLGNVVLNIRWGNHVGDWEHTLIRFQHGKPRVVFLSEHNFGSAYSYSALEKLTLPTHPTRERPVVYSAIGSHAMYATAGLQPYILPLGLLHDATSRGPLWDPALNLHAFSYNPTSDTLTASSRTPHSPTGWFFFNGKWGDKAYPLSDPRQYGWLGEYHYVNGPLGPRFKNLGRRKVCQGRFEDECVVKHWLEAAGGVEIPRVGKGEGEGDDWPGEEELMPPMTGGEIDPGGVV